MRVASVLHSSRCAAHQQGTPRSEGEKENAKKGKEKEDVRIIAKFCSLFLPFSIAGRGKREEGKEENAEGKGKKKKDTSRSANCS